MTTERQLRKDYGTTRRRVMLCADKQTEAFILDAQERLTELTGAKPSLSVAMTYLIKEGHKATTSNH